MSLTLYCSDIKHVIALDPTSASEYNHSLQLQTEKLHFFVLYANTSAVRITFAHKANWISWNKT